MRNALAAVIAAACLVFYSGAASAAEICGNSIDDDGNGLTDEGCYPTMTTGVCESPLSCDDTGMVSWATGALHYDLPPDEAVHVPFGPPLAFHRYYASMSSPGSNPGSVNKTPFGPGWGHDYLSWVYPYTVGTTKYAIFHTPQGREILFTKSSFDGTYDHYTPQPGYHVLDFKGSVDLGYYVQLLTGETFRYNTSGQLIEIWDTLPTPNKLTIAWDSTTNGNVSTVTDASGKHRLSFTYSSSRVSTTRLQHISGTDWVTDHTTSYSFTYPVSQDATSGWYIPADATEWANLLEGTDIPIPTTVWPCQQFFGDLITAVGTVTLALTNAGGVNYHQTVSGWSRTAVTLADGTTSHWRSSSSLCNPATTQCSMLALVAVTANGTPVTTRDIIGMGDSNGAIGQITNTGRVGTTTVTGESWKGTSASGGTITAGVHPWVMSADPIAGTTSLTTDIGTATPTWSTGTSANGNVTLGSLLNTSQPSSYLYAAQWTGTALTAAQRATLIDRIKNGPAKLLATVTLGGQLAQKYTYGGASVLTKIQDGANNELISFQYSSSVTGRINKVSTTSGNLGFDYGSFRASCTGSDKTLVYFNKGNETSCSTDGDCGTGYLCGGQTGSGATGSCYLAARCLTTSTVSGESVVKDVSSIGPGGSCTGACAQVMKHIWSAASGVVDEIATEDANTPNNGYTSMDRCVTTGGQCTASYPKQIGFGDTDADPTNGGWNRTMWIYYDSTYPGRIAEIRRPSDLSASSSLCSYTSVTGCDRVIYHYGNAASGCASDNQLCDVEHQGYTLNSSGAVVLVTSHVITAHDSAGRIVDASGPLIGNHVHYDYYPPADPNSGQLMDVKTYYDLTHYLTTNITAYDGRWWSPTSVVDPSGNSTCYTYDADLGYVSSVTQAHINCSTPNGADRKTAFQRDSWPVHTHRRNGDVIVISTEMAVGGLLQMTRPDQSCILYSYNTKHQLAYVRRRDDCNSLSGGDYQQFQYTSDGAVKQIDTYNVFGAVTKSDVVTYFDGGQVQSIVNPNFPLDPSKSLGFQYDAAGHLTEVDGPSALSKSVLMYTGSAGRDGLVTSDEEYRDTAFDAWTLLYSWDGLQARVTDGDGKVIVTQIDDFGQTVEMTSPDFTNPTLMVHDLAGNPTALIEDFGGGVGVQRNHSFAYDLLNRQTSADYDNSPHCGTHATIARQFDAYPTCPAGMSTPCSDPHHLEGRLAYVNVVLMCDPGFADGSLDQQTYYVYDEFGQVKEEFITDDSGRTADHVYGYTVDGALSSVTLPSTAVVQWNYGGGVGNNSDTDLITQVLLNSTSVADSVQWYSFGPLMQYNQSNKIGTSAIQTTIQRNLAYRPTDVKQQAGATLVLDASVGEDAAGQVTSRVYSGAATGVQSSYFLYDKQGRVTCETTDFQSTCPTSGADIKNAHSLSPPFTAAGDWKRVLRPVPGSTGGLVNDFNSSGTTYGTSHQIDDVNQSDGSPAFGHTAFTYDDRGNRTSDDNPASLSLSHDERTYTYDGRRNLTSVRGEYFIGGAWHYYDVVSSFDAENRRVFKSFHDESSGKTATWFFYYDLMNRLTEVLYTPDISTSATHSWIELVWLQDRLIAYQQSDYPGPTVSKRYVGTAANGRPVDMWSWPPNGDATRVWAINPSAWGFDKVVVGASLYQPILFPGQYQDVETTAYVNDGATVHRPGLALNGYRTYDPFVGGYLQVDPLADQTWNSYVYAGGNPVSSVDPSGLQEFNQEGPQSTGQDTNIFSGLWSWLTDAAFLLRRNHAGFLSSRVE